MTLGEALKAATSRLAAAGIEAPQREARLLLEAVTGIGAATLLGFPERTMPPEALPPFEASVERRARREPLSKIVGKREFWSLDFEVTADTLDPRPDTETIVEAALAHTPATSARVLDLGTGTGCILLSILHERPAWRGLGIDRSEAAARVARRNAARLGLADRAAFAVGDWDAALHGRFDLIVSNPPYIPAETIGTLEPDVRCYDPRAALDGGADGLDAYRALAALLPDRLAPGGIAVLELGIGQDASVARLLAMSGLVLVELRADLAGIPRALVACRADTQK